MGRVTTKSAGKRPGIVASRLVFAAGLTAVTCGLIHARAETTLFREEPPPKHGLMERVQVSRDGSHFVTATSGQRFVAWGFNYDHDAGGRLIEDYWDTEWDTVVEDFAEMKALGANMVRIHLQVGRFMLAADQPNKSALQRLVQLLQLAEQTRMYVDLTGLGCYHRQAVPAWYDALEEAQRWEVQARFWEAVASVGQGSPAVFCYDLMNEPVVPGGHQPETDWLAGEFGGKHFVQRIALDPAGRSQREIAKAWVERLVRAIRREDSKTLLTVGVIPWVQVFPGAEPLFYAPEVGAPLDFVSVHFYPKAGEVAPALSALAIYDIGKPLVIEEWFPLQCSLGELDQFRQGSQTRVDGWMGFYWGKTPRDYDGDPSIPGMITRSWLQYFEKHAPVVERP